MGYAPSEALRDPVRLTALRGTALLDSPPEPAFDRLTRLAAHLLRAPVAIVSLVDDTRAYFKSGYGIPASVRELPLASAPCQHAVASRLPLVIEDSRTDPRTCDFPPIPGLDVIAYAGAPLRTAAGEVLGTFCVIDTVPRRWTGHDMELLETLAESVMTEVGLRASVHEATTQAAAAGALAAERDELLERIPEALLTVDARWRSSS
jgi:GAF domain-containing protein